MYVLYVYEFIRNAIKSLLDIGIELELNAIVQYTV